MDLVLVIGRCLYPQFHTPLDFFKINLFVKHRTSCYNSTLDPFKVPLIASKSNSTRNNYVMRWQHQLCEVRAMMTLTTEGTAEECGSAVVNTPQIRVWKAEIWMHTIPERNNRCITRRKKV